MNHADAQTLHSKRWTALAIWIAVFSTALLYFFGEIQKNSRDNCKRAYRVQQDIIIAVYSKPVLSPSLTPDQMEKLIKRLHQKEKRLLDLASPDKCDDIHMPFWTSWY